MVDTDPEDSELFSVWCGNGQGSSGEIAGRICDETYAAFIVRAVNAHDALVEALENAEKTLVPYEMVAVSEREKGELAALLVDVRKALKLAKIS